VMQDLIWRWLEKKDNR